MTRLGQPPVSIRYERLLQTKSKSTAKRDGKANYRDDLTSAGIPGVKETLN